MPRSHPFFSVLPSRAADPRFFEPRISFRARVLEIRSAVPSSERLPIAPVLHWSYGPALGRSFSVVGVFAVAAVRAATVVPSARGRERNVLVSRGASTRRAPEQRRHSFFSGPAPRVLRPSAPFGNSNGRTRPVDVPLVS